MIAQFPISFDPVVVEVSTVSDPSDEWVAVAHSDGVVVVDEAEKISRQVVEHMTKSVRLSGSTILGVIIHGARCLISEMIYKQL